MFRKLIIAIDNEKIVYIASKDEIMEIKERCHDRDIQIIANDIDEIILIQDEVEMIDRDYILKQTRGNKTSYKYTNISIMKP